MERTTEDDLVTSGAHDSSCRWYRWAGRNEAAREVRTCVALVGGLWEVEGREAKDKSRTKSDPGRRVISPLNWNRGTRGRHRICSWMPRKDGLNWRQWMDQVELRVWRRTTTFKVYGPTSVSPLFSSLLVPWKRDSLGANGGEAWNNLQKTPAEVTALKPLSGPNPGELMYPPCNSRFIAQG